MATSNGSSEPTERTGLLDDPTKAVNGAVDEESGESETEDNALIDGDPDRASRLLWLLPTVGLGVLLSAADQTLVVTMYARIGSDLNALNNTSWIATAYFLTLTSFQPLYGKMSDIFGRKPALIFAYSIFGIGCACCGFARNLEELVAARAFAGIGGGGMTTVVSILFSDIVPLRERGTWQGYMNLVYALGASMGAPLGGLLSDSIGWRWAFLGQSPLCLLAIIIVYFTLELPKIDDSHWKEKLRKVDFLGALSLITAVSTLLVGMDRGSNVAWSDKITIICCCSSIPLFSIFIGIEMKVASHPFAPGHIILNPSLFSAYICNFWALAGHILTIFYVPLYLQVIDNISATRSGARLIPVMIFSVGGSIFGGFCMQKTGRYYWLTISCLCLSVVGSLTVCLSAGIFDFSWGLTFGLSFMAFGTGSMITTTLISVLANSDPADQAIATACTYLFRSLGSVVGVSLGSTIVQQSLRTQLIERLKNDGRADEIVEKVRQSLDFIKELDPKTKAIVVMCYQRATTFAFVGTVTLTCVALFCSFWIKEKRLIK